MSNNVIQFTIYLIYCTILDLQRVALFMSEVYPLMFVICYYL